MDRKKPLIVVLSRNYSTGLCVIRSLGSIGYTVDLIASAKKQGASRAISSSKYVRNAVEIVSNKVNGGGEAKLVEALLSYAGSCEEKPILLPTDDYTTSVMDIHRDLLEDIFIMPKIVDGEAGCLKHHMDKSVQGEIARSVGILTPKEWVISLKDESISIPVDMIYPCFCKPLESSLGYKQEMAKCDDQQELEEHLYKLKKNFNDRSVLVQEFLEIDEEIDLEGVCLDQQIILPGIIWKRIVAKFDKGVPLAGQTFSMNVLGDFQKKIEAFLQKFHYFGMFDLGFNIVGSKIYFNELNMRSGGTNYVYFKSGVNLPEIFVKESLGMSHQSDEVNFREFGLTYLYEDVAWNDYLHDYLDKSELDYNMKNADITFMNDEIDPEPFAIFMENAKNREAVKLRKQELMDTIMEATGWTKERTEKNVKEVRQRCGATLKDYVGFSLWKYDSIDEQVSKYKPFSERRDRIRQLRKECISATVAATGWDFDYAKQHMADVRQRLNISYKDYMKLELWKYDNFEEQKIAYEKLLERREKIKKRKEDCITNAMEMTSWDYEFAKAQIRDTRKRLGITYKDYQRYKFCLIPIEKQKEYYEEILNQKKK